MTKNSTVAEIDLALRIGGAGDVRVRYHGGSGLVTASSYGEEVTRASGATLQDALWNLIAKLEERRS